MLSADIKINFKRDWTILGGFFFLLVFIALIFDIYAGINGWFVRVDETAISSTRLPSLNRAELDRLVKDWQVREEEFNAVLGGGNVDLSR